MCDTRPYGFKDVRWQTFREMVRNGEIVFDSGIIPGTSKADPRPFLPPNAPRGRRPGLHGPIWCNGRALTLKQWAEAIGITYAALQSRLGRMSMERAIALPPNAKCGRPKKA